LFSSSQHAFDAHAPADARRRLAADQFDQAVVAPAAAHRALRAQAVGHPLEDREVVVVHAAHQARVDAVGLAGGVQHARTASKCLSDSPRKSSSCGAASTSGLHGRVLGVQDAQRVAVQAALRLGVQQLAVASKCAISAARWARRSAAGPGC
jgi:hypothetical protein